MVPGSGLSSSEIIQTNLDPDDNSGAQPCTDSCGFRSIPWGMISGEISIFSFLRFGSRFRVDEFRIHITQLVLLNAGVDNSGDHPVGDFGRFRPDSRGRTFGCFLGLSDFWVLSYISACRLYERISMVTSMVWTPG